MCTLFRLMLLIVLLPGVCLPATTGKIAGAVIDEATRDPLPGVTIYVLGTDLHAVSGPRGEYFILNVPAGSYEVEARMIGYLPVRNAKVSVNADLTTRVDFSLKTTILDVMDPVVITAPRPMVRTDLTASSEVLTAEELQPLPVTDLSDLILLQSGVVRDAQGNLHVRGGRSDEISYYVDDVSIQDPLLGSLGTHIHLDTIEELVINRGGFDAQYGEAMSGVVNIVTKEGSARYAGRFRGVTGMQPQYDVTRGSYGRSILGQSGRLEGVLSGALPGLKDRVSFFLSGQHLRDGHYLPHNGRTLTTAAANLVFKPHPLLKLKLSGHLALRRQDIYDHRDQNGLSYDFNLDGLPERYDYSHAVNLSLSHTLSPRTFYTARFYRYTTASRMAPGMLFDRHWTEWPGYSEDEAGRYNGTIYETNLLRSDRYQNLPFTDGADFFPIYRKSRTTYYGARFDLSSQITYHNQVRAGLEMQWYRLLWNEKTFLQPTPSGQQYTANPVEGAFYVQNKLELARLIVNGGIRVDYFDTGQRFFVSLPTGQAELRNSPTKVRLSPRIGLSHPLTSRSLLRFSYGYFYQPPEFRFAYENLQRDLNGDFPRVGNPNLDPQKTVAYEAGLEYALGDDWRASATAAYKEVSNLTSTTQVQYPGGTYWIFTNADFGTVRSFEFSIKRSIARAISGSVNYTYAVTQGSASDPQESFSHLKITAEGEPSPSTRNVFPLAFDQRHKLTAVLTMRTPDNASRRFLRGLSLAVIGYYGSGLPYTPTNAIGEPQARTLNTARLPSMINLDLRVRKRFQWGKTSYALFTEVQNLLNRRNVIGVYANTGSPADDGYTLETFENKTPGFVHLRRLLSLDPQHYTAPREIRFGFEVAF